MRLFPLVLIAACNCTANIDATFESTPSEAEVCEVEHVEMQTAKLRAKDAVIDDTLQVGPEVPEADTQRAVFSAIDNLTRVMVTIDSDSETNHNSGGGSNQITNLWLKATGGFDTTTQNGVNRALEIIAACSVDAGAGTCEDTAIIANATNGYSWRSETGTMRHDGPVQFGTGVSPSTVTLGANVQPFLLKGTNGTATQIHVGWDSTPGNVNSGTSIAVKNAQAGVSTGGISVALDTSISGASGVRGGLILTRGANGGLVSGLSSGLVFAGGTGYPFVASAANELTLYDELGAGIVFGADNTGYTSAFRLTPKNHLVVDTSTGAPTLTSCGTSPTITGNDMAFKLVTGSAATGCTITFKNSYTSAPICSWTPQGGTTLPTCSAAAGAITCSTAAASTTYNVMCIGVPGST